MPWLIWIFVGRTGYFVCFVVLRLKYTNFEAVIKMSRDMTKPANECAPSEDSDQPGHPPSLIRVFAVRMKKTWVLIYPLSAQRRLWSDWADAEADMSLCWAHMPFCWLCHEAAQFWKRCSTKRQPTETELWPVVVDNLFHHATSFYFILLSLDPVTRRVVAEFPVIYM